MRYRLSMGLAALVMINIVGSAAGWGVKPSRLEAFAARQQLRDMVCIAMADGQINAYERSEILGDAKQILTSGEFPAFKRALDRLSPPPKKKAAKRRVKKQRPTPPAKPRHQKRPEAKPYADLIIPVTAILPDRMVNFIRAL